MVICPFPNNAANQLSAKYTYDENERLVKNKVIILSETVTTGYVGDYFEVVLGTPIDPGAPSGSNCSVNHCVFFPMVLRGSSVPEGHAWISYYYAGGQRVAERVQSNQQGQVSGGYYMLTDHLGSTTVILEAGGNPVGELRYSAFGGTRFTDGDTPTTYHYTGQREDSYINLYWYGSRWYDSTLGRFTSADSMVPQPGNVLAWDRYSYTLNNPVRYTDPSGHAAE